MDTDDFIDIFAGKVEEPIGHSIEFLSVLMASTANGIEPSIFWLKTSDQTWHRFFLDAWVPHWNIYNEKEKTDLIEDDLENDVIGEIKYFVKDLMADFNLQHKKVECAGMSYAYRDQLFFGNLKIKIQGSREINIYDYGDEINSELYLDDILIEK